MLSLGELIEQESQKRGLLFDGLRRGGRIEDRLDDIHEVEQIVVGGLTSSTMNELPYLAKPIFHAHGFAPP